jgi:hypothetical protein
MSRFWCIEIPFLPALKNYIQWTGKISTRGSNKKWDTGARQTETQKFRFANRKK